MADRRGFAILLATPLMVLGCMDSVYGVDDLSYEDGVKVCDGGRFVVLELGSEDCDARDGSGFVLDLSTGLTWIRTSYYPGVAQTQAQASGYCLSKGMRLPTKEEALGIATKPGCAFPCWFETWTSSMAGSDQAWVVSDEGYNYPYYVSDNRRVVCVR